MGVHAIPVRIDNNALSCQAGDMATEEINIPDRQADFIRELIAAGQYQDINEVIRVSVHLLEERHVHEQTQKAKLRAMLDEALAGGISERSPEEVWADAEARYLKENA